MSSSSFPDATGGGSNVVPQPQPQSQTQEEMRAAAYKIIRRQSLKKQHTYGEEGGEDPLMSISQRSASSRRKAEEEADTTANETEQPVNDDDEDDITECSFEITHPAPLSSRRTRESMSARPKGTIPIWPFAACGCIVVIIVTTCAVWFTRDIVVWQWEILPQYTKDVILADFNSTQPQTKAWQYLKRHDDFHSMPEWRVLQLMATTSIYYANYYLLGWPPVDIELLQHECIWWLGSKCDDDGHMIQLSLYKRDMDGSLPRQIGLLTKLGGLSMSDNQLTGTLPSQLGELTLLNFLAFNANNMTGPLPTQLGRLTALTQLSVRKNEMTGTMPTQLGLLANTTTLDLSANNFTGTVPTAYGQLTALTYLPLGQNPRLTGNIPSELGGLQELTILDVHQTQMTGTVPLELQSMTMIRSLLFHETRLSGEIPSPICDAPNLLEIWVNCSALKCNCPKGGCQCHQ